MSHNKSRLSRVSKITQQTQALRRKVLSYTHEQVKAMIMQPKESEEYATKRPKSPDLSRIPEANDENVKINADADLEAEIKEKVEYTEGLASANPYVFDDKIVAMFRNVEVIKKKMPEYGYKFLQPKP